MKAVTYTDKEGRLWRTLIPDGAPETESQARMGIPAGPMSTEELEWPQEFQVRLHNQLYHRRIFTPRDAVLRQQDIQAALMAALKLDVQTIVSLYRPD